MVTSLDKLHELGFSKRTVNALYRARFRKMDTLYKYVQSHTPRKLFRRVPGLGLKMAEDLHREVLKLYQDCEHEDYDIGNTISEIAIDNSTKLIVSKVSCPDCYRQGVLIETHYNNDTEDHWINGEINFDVRLEYND